MINNPVGLGAVVTILGLLSVIILLLQFKKLFKKENEWKMIALLWLAFTFLLLNSLTFNLPVGFFGFRVWMLMAVPLSLLCVEGMWFLMNLGKQFSVNKSIILGVVVLGIMITSWYPKYEINTSLWMTDPFASLQELEHNSNFFLRLPPHTKVFTFYDGFKSRLIGLNMASCEWCPEIWNYRKDLYYKTPQEINQWLKSKEYEYAVVDFMYVKDGEENRNISRNITLKQMNDLVASQLFVPVHQTEGRIVLKVI